MEKTKTDIVADTQVVVLMGGLGTRLGLKDRPKAMADVCGVPFFDYQLRLLKRWRFHRFLFLVGHQSEQVKAYYGDGSKWQIEIRYADDGPIPLGTGGALKHTEEKLEDDFLLLYGDSFMDIDYQEVVYRYHMAKAAKKSGLMTIFENRDQFDKSNVIYRDGEILLYDKKHRQKEMLYIDYGVSMLSKDILAGKESGKAFDVAALFTELSQNGKLAAQIVEKRFYEIGNPDSLQEFRNYVQRRFGEKKKAVFLDRDGVINDLVFHEETEQLDSPFRQEDFHYKLHVIQTLKWIQQQGFYLFIVTNQPAAAKGKIPLSQLYNLNTWMVRDLKRQGIEIEFSALCPHHPSGSDQKTTAGFLIQDCACRKPKPGMIVDLLQVYNIDPARSYMVGDSYTDISAGKEAGLKTILLGSWKCDICQRLEGNRPNAIIQDIAELEKILE